MKIITPFFLSINILLCTFLLYSINVHSQNEIKINPPVFELAGTSDSPYSTTDGKVRLVWSHDLVTNSDMIIQFELQQSEHESFSDSKTIYEGQDLASFISGLPNGTYYFRVRAHDPSTPTTSAWSDSLVVNVQHYSLSFAFTLMFIGGIVFLLTILVVVYGTLTVDKKTNKTH